MMKNTVLVITSFAFCAIPNFTENFLFVRRVPVPIIEPKVELTIAPKNELDLILEDVCEIDHKLVRIVIERESRNNHTAKSHKGAIGLMQLMPSTAKHLNVDPYNKRENVKGGCEYLGKQLKTFNGNVKLALAAYNAGPGNVLKFGGVPPFKETQKYVEYICSNYNCKEKYVA